MNWNVNDLSDIFLTCADYRLTRGYMEGIDILQCGGPCAGDGRSRKALKYKATPAGGRTSFRSDLISCALNYTQKYASNSCGCQRQFSQR